MALKQAEDLQQLQKQYEQALDQYEALEKALAEATQQRNQAAADELYAQMQAQYPLLDTLYKQLSNARSELAETRDNARAALA
jgi:hypothetical protein